jgi:hypothetical protein
MTFVRTTTVHIYECTSRRQLSENVSSWCRAVANNLHDRVYGVTPEVICDLSGFISFGNARALELDDNERWREEARAAYRAERES